LKDFNEDDKKFVIFCGANKKWYYQPDSGDPIKVTKLELIKKSGS